MPAPDVQYFLDCSLECGHIAGDVHHYFMEVAVDSNEVLDAYDSEGRTFHKHWSSLADTGLHMERNFLNWRGSSAADPLKRQSASFMGLWSSRPLIEEHLKNAAQIAVSAGHVRWTPEARALLDKEFEFSSSMAVSKRSLNRAAADFDGWDDVSLIDMRLAVERQRHDNSMAQVAAIRRIRGLLGANLLEAEEINNRVGPLFSERDIKRAKRVIAERQKRERGVIKRSTRFLSKLVGNETTRLYVGGTSIRVEGRHANYELTKRSTLLDPHGGWAALAVYHKDHPDLHLCDLCIYTHDVPLLDHVASLIMHIKTGHEEDILSIGNANNCAEEAYELEWLAPHLPNRHRGGEFGLDDMRIVIPRQPWEVEHVRDKARKTEAVMRDLRRYAYEEIFEPHRKLLSGMRAAIGHHIPIYLEDFGRNDCIMPLAVPTADIRGLAEQEIQDGLDAMDEVLNQLPQPRDQNHMRQIEAALEQLFDADTEWVD